MNKIKLLIVFIASLSLFSCKTYTIAVDSFRQQMIQTGSGELKEVEVQNPLPNTFSNIKYLANTLKFIKVVDKKGQVVELENSPKLEMRVTRKNGKKTVFMFDTVIVENDTIKGSRSRIIQSLTKEIPLSMVEKIQIQDSGKVYQYQ